MNKPERYKLACFLAILILLVLVSGCQKSSQQDAAPSTEKIIPVTLTRPLQQDIDITLHAVGIIESLSSPVISGETNGKVVSIHVDEGDKVKAGEPLVTLDDRHLEILMAQEQSELKRFQIMIGNKKRTLNRRRKLARTKSISEDSVDEAETELSTLQAQKTLSENKIAAIQYKLDKTRIKSPITATVLKRYISKGDYIKEGEHVFKLVNLSKLRIRLPVPENKVPELLPGQSVLLSTPASSYKSKAEISRLLPSINEKNKALDIILDIDNPGDWRPGASVIASIILKHFEQALLLPKNSIVKRPAGDVVYVYDKQSHTVKQRVIKTGHMISSESKSAAGSNSQSKKLSLIQIISGLTKNEAVIVNGASYLTDNATVSVLSHD